MTRNMDIDEAIAHERQKAKDNRNEFYTFGVQKCKQCAEEHEQLAEWLELLKWYQQGMEDIPSESGVLPKDVYSAGYNKALEDYHRLIADEIKNDTVNPYLLHLYNFNNHIKKCLTKR